MLNMRKIRNVFFLISLVISGSAFAGDLGGCIYSDFESWKDCFVKDRLSLMMNDVDVETFRQARYIDRVIELDTKQPEKSLSFDEYKNIINLKGKIERAKVFYSENKTLVTKIASTYEVDPEILVALLAMESDLGKIQGKFNIIDSLATLAYDGRRSEFFQKELINALMISKFDDISYERLKGSWAGAMGMVQFMPSSYLKYAVDYDSDGVRNIWTSKPDAIASAANYLKQNGWVEGHIKLLPEKDNAAWENNNCEDNSGICKVKADLWLIKLSKNDINSFFYVTPNFGVLMKWNKSNYFGVANLMIANSLKRKS